MRTRTLVVGLLLGACAASLAHERHGQKGGPARPQAQAHGGVRTGLDDQNVAPPRPAQSELKVFLSHFNKPEYIHVLINPLPIYGMALGAALLLAGLRLESDGMREAGLALVVLAGAITFPTVLFGQRAYDRLYEQIALEGQQWLDEHMSRAENLQWLFYATAILAAWALIRSRKKKPAAWRQAQVSLAAAGLCAALAGWISHAGGQVRHEEFRLGPPARNAQPMGDHQERTTEP